MLVLTTPGREGKRAPKLMHRVVCIDHACDRQCRFVARLLRHIPKVRKLVKDEPAALLAALNPYLNDEV